MAPSGHRTFLVNNTREVDLLLMHNKTFAAEYVEIYEEAEFGLILHRISHAVSSRKRVEIIARAKELGVKVTNPKAKVTVEV